MSSAATIRLQIETALARRIPSALTPAQKIIRPVAPTGVAAVDELLHGGLPIGAITEMTGPESSGRTSLALSFLARVMREGGVGAWIDAGDTLHPESAAAASVDLSRLLWVRCGVSAATPEPAASYRFSLPDEYRGVLPKKSGGFGAHPRNETKGLSNAVGDLLKPEVTAPRCAEPQPRRKPERKTFEPQPLMPQQKPRQPVRRKKPWSRIEQALHATDLLLQGGGFSAIVLDLAGVAPEHASRIELSIWFRYRAAVERTQASLLLLTQHPCAKSAGELLLRFHPGNARCDEKTVFAGIEHGLEVERRRFAPNSLNPGSSNQGSTNPGFSNLVPLKKPSQSEHAAHWRSQSTWAGAR